MALEDDPFAGVTVDGETNVVRITDQRVPTIHATPFTWRDPVTIPRRRFLYGYELRRGQVSAVVAPGAAGKTTFKVGRALCMALGRDLFGHRVWDGPHRVWLWNLEDEQEEIEKTIHGFIKHWNLDPADLEGRLFIDGVDSAHTRLLKLAIEDNRHGVQLQRPIADALIAELKELRIDYLDVDPFVSSHGVDENSNHAIDLVTKEWVRVAQGANCAISLAHHLRKTTGTEFTANDARGAGAMIAAARSCLVLQRMSREAAQEFRVADCDRRKYFSVYDDKNNKAPPAQSAEWYEFVSVGLGNGDETGPEDNIGVVQRWHAPDLFAGVTAYQLLKIQELVNDNPMRARYHSSAKNWVGKQVAYVLDRDLGEKTEAAAIKRMVDKWISTGALRKVEKLDEKREPREFVEVGVWAEVGE